MSIFQKFLIIYNGDTVKKILLFLVTLFVLCSCRKYSINGKEKDDYWVQNYIVMEQSTRKIIEERNASYCQSVASISKIMTAIIAIESNKLNQVVRVGEEIRSIYGSQVYLKLNDELLLEELVYGLLLRSGNDCAVVIASFISGSSIEFAKLMNDKANELKMTSSIFKNPHGLDEEDGGNISNCRDMAILHAYCLDNQTYRKISSAENYKSSKYGVWKNKNRLIDEYEFTTGGKTGYTVKAKRTLITSAKKENTEFIIVTLNCISDFKFHKSKYEEMFDRYENKLLFKKGVNNIDEYKFEVDKELFFFQSKEEWSESRLLYHLNEDEEVLEIYLLKENNEKYFLSQYGIIEEDDDRDFFEKVRNYIKNLFT